MTLSFNIFCKALVENVDNLLEKVDIHLDHMAGRNTNDRLPAVSVTTNPIGLMRNFQFNKRDVID